MGTERERFAGSVGTGMWWCERVRGWGEAGRRMARRGEVLAESGGRVGGHDGVEGEREVMMVWEAKGCLAYGRRQG